MQVEGTGDSGTHESRLYDSLLVQAGEIKELQRSVEGLLLQLLLDCDDAARPLLPYEPDLKVVQRLAAPGGIGERVEDGRGGGGGGEREDIGGFDGGDAIFNDWDCFRGRDSSTSRATRRELSVIVGDRIMSVKVGLMSWSSSVVGSKWNDGSWRVEGEAW